VLVIVLKLWLGSVILFRVLIKLNIRDTFRARVGLGLGLGLGSGIRIGLLLCLGYGRS
jgi:hypothetical protein